MAISNGSFELGTFFQWQTVGDTSIETQDIGSPPTDGDFQGLLTTSASDSGGPVLDSDLDDFIDLSSIDDIFDVEVTEGSAIRQTFFAEEGDTLTFDFNFLTNETLWDSNPETFNDFAFYNLFNNSNPITPIPVKLADTGDTVFPSSTSFDTETGIESASIEISETGTYTLSIGVVDVDDSGDDFNSALLIDNIQIIPSDGFLPERPPLG